MRNSVPTVILIFCLGMMVACGLSKEEKEVAKIPPPYMSPWLDTETLRTSGPAEEVVGSIKGRVTVCRSTSEERCYSLQLEIYEVIPVGSEVKVSRLCWQITKAQKIAPESCQLIITEVLSVLSKK